MFSFAKELRTASLSILLIFLLLGLEFLFQGEIALNNIEIVLIVLAIQIPVTTLFLVKMRSITDESSRMRRAIKHTLSYGLCLSTAITLSELLESQAIEFGEILRLFLIPMIANFAIQYFFNSVPLKNKAPNDYYSEAKND